MVTTPINPATAKKAAMRAALLVLALAAILSFGAASSLAYEGPFCYKELRNEFKGCYSVKRNNIRRSIGHVSNSWVMVEVETNIGLKVGSCFEYLGCKANTGYLKADGTGRGWIWNEGPNGTQYTYGYLYK